MHRQEYAKYEVTQGVHLDQLTSILMFILANACLAAAKESIWPFGRILYARSRFSENHDDRITEVTVLNDGKQIKKLKSDKQSYLRFHSIPHFKSGVACSMSTLKLCQYNHT